MNRKQRRAKETSNASIKTADDIPLSQPDKTTSARTTRTLFEIAAEKQAQLTPGGQQFSSGSAFNPDNVVEVKIGEDGKVIQNAGLTSLGVDVTERSETPWLDAILLTSSLAAIHFTLEVLTMHQYAQELRFPPIFAKTILVALPTLLVVVCLFRGLLLPISIKRFPTTMQLGLTILVQVIYSGVANVAGCYLIHLTHDKGYYAVMKNAPAVGTIWVWAVLESGLFDLISEGHCAMQADNEKTHVQRTEKTEESEKMRDNSVLRSDHVSVDPG